MNVTNVEIHLTPDEVKELIVHAIGLRTFGLNFVADDFEGEAKFGGVVLVVNEDNMIHAGDVIGRIKNIVQPAKFFAAG